MTPTPTQRFCSQLRDIVGFLENGDRAAAAKAAAELEQMVATLPRTMPEVEIAEARQLLERYGVLAEHLRQETVASMKRLGAARHLSAYGRHGRRP
jgi:hypothetical protein